MPLELTGTPGLSILAIIFVAIAILALLLEPGRR